MAFSRFPPASLALAFFALGLHGAFGADAPSREGLVLWLDASDRDSLELGPDGAVARWEDKSPRAVEARAGGGGKGAARLVEDALNGRPAVRFDGASWFDVPALRDTKGPATVLTVSQRSAGQVSEVKWQRLVSSWDERAQEERLPPGFCVTADEPGVPGGPGPYEARIGDEHLTDVFIGPLRIGANRRGGGWFSGDIAEILIYDRAFLSEDALLLALEYLQAKWGARIAREDKGWTRVGLLGETPERITDAFPLSDQKNEGGWVRYEPMSDEFDGDALDAAKWSPIHPRWKGRQPALFWDRNVRVAEGELQLIMRKEEAPGMPRAQGYHDYTSAVVISLEKVLYGYFEVRAKPMNSAGSSSFWFAGTADGWRTEIDVFEIGGAAEGFEYKYNMNLHVFYTPEENRHWNIGGRWIAPWRLADDFHVYGFRWDKDMCEYFVDGTPVRRVKNTHWHQPLTMIFDSETMPDWFGMPRDEDLPSTYRIDYVRAWKREETSQ